jgi:hypothetical protein
VTELEHDVPLFHWSPAVRRKQIIRHGLRPRQRPVTSSHDFRQPVVCFAESPSWAWALSGDFHPEVSLWDLWQTSLRSLTDPILMPSYDSHRWHEVRTEHRVFKRDLWLVGQRTP